MDYSKKQFKDIIKSSISDVFAGIILLLVSYIVNQSRFEILRSPIFNFIIGLVFILLAYFSFNSREYSSKKEQILNFDLNGLIVGATLLVIGFLSLIGQFAIVRNFMFPVVPGILLFTVGFARIYIRTSDPDVVMDRLESVGIVGGEALMFYSLLLYMGIISLAWNPIFPLVIAVALYMTFFIDILPQIRTDGYRIHDALKWLDDIEDKIARLKSEFESIKLNYNDPQVKKSLERLNEIYQSLIEIKELKDYEMQRIMTPEPFAKPEVARSKPVIEPFKKKPPQPAAMQNNNHEAISEIKSSELSELVGFKSSDEIFYENLQEEFDKHGLGEIIKEAKLMRKSLNAQRQLNNDQ